MPIQIDMDMPQNCRKCPFVSYTKSKRMVCRLTEEEFDESEEFFERFITCPLKEVK